MPVIFSRTKRNTSAASRNDDELQKSRLLVNAKTGEAVFQDEHGFSRRNLAVSFAGNEKLTASVSTRWGREKARSRDG